MAAINIQKCNLFSSNCLVIVNAHSQVSANLQNERLELVQDNISRKKC
jgi:hypothetical protein